ncbi:hypothetical protein BRAS3843_620031 [Bradyrhizobium sp. STM 3843]|nr:hypothetical protein BRAS3843_620031 [Bradyrhizobium sp. STM 3843]
MECDSGLHRGVYGNNKWLVPLVPMPDFRGTQADHAACARSALTRVCCLPTQASVMKAIRPAKSWRR